MEVPKLGRVQFKIMQFLWENGRANARQITEALNEEETIAHSTVQTLLRKLEAKGAVAHDAEDRTFVFYPLVKEEKAKRSAAHELIERAFGGSPVGLVAYLLEDEKVSAEELREIRRLIDESEKTQP